jgi:hypothetical protein
VRGPFRGRQGRTCGGAPALLRSKLLHQDEVDRPLSQVLSERAGWIASAAPAPAPAELTLVDCIEDTARAAFLLFVRG